VLANINQFIRTDFVYAAQFVSGYIYDLVHGPVTPATT